MTAHRHLTSPSASPAASPSSDPGARCLSKTAPRVVGWLIPVAIIFCSALFVVGQTVSMFSLGRSVTVHFSSVEHWNGIVLPPAATLTSARASASSSARKVCADNDEAIAEESAAFGAPWLKSCADVKSYGICEYDKRLEVTCCVACGFGVPTVPPPAAQKGGNSSSTATSTALRGGSSSSDSAADAPIRVGLGEEEVYVMKPFMPMSFMLSVEQLWATGEPSQRAIAACIFVLSGVWPHLKLLLVLACWCLPARLLPGGPRGRRRVLAWTSRLGKFSLVDPLVVMLIMAVFTTGFSLHRGGDASAHDELFRRAASAIAEEMDFELVGFGSGFGSNSNSASSAPALAPAYAALAQAKNLTQRQVLEGRMERIDLELGMYAWSGVIYFCGAVWVSLAVGAVVERYSNAELAELAALEVALGAAEAEEEVEGEEEDGAAEEKAAVAAAVNAETEAVAAEEEEEQELLSPAPDCCSCSCSCTRRYAVGVCAAALAAAAVVVLVAVGAGALPLFTREVRGSWGVYMHDAASTMRDSGADVSSSSSGGGSGSGSGSGGGGGGGGALYHFKQFVGAVHSWWNQGSSSSSSNSRDNGVALAAWEYDPTTDVHADLVGFRSIGSFIFDPHRGDSAFLGITWLVFCLAAPLLAALARLRRAVGAASAASTSAAASSAGKAPARWEEWARLLPGVDALAVLLLCAVVVLVEVGKFTALLPLGFCHRAALGAFEHYVDLGECTRMEVGLGGGFYALAAVVAVGAAVPCMLPRRRRRLQVAVGGGAAGGGAVTATKKAGQTLEEGQQQQQRSIRP